MIRGRGNSGCIRSIDQYNVKLETLGFPLGKTFFGPTLLSEILKNVDVELNANSAAICLSHQLDNYAINKIKHKLYHWVKLICSRRFLADWLTW